MLDLFILWGCFALVAYMVLWGLWEEVEIPGILLDKAVVGICVFTFMMSMVVWVCLVIPKDLKIRDCERKEIIK